LAILKVCRMGHPVLRAQAEEVSSEEIRGTEFQNLVNSMIDTMIDYDGVGLAGPQVHVSRRVCVVRVDGEDDETCEVLVLINPTVTPVGDRQETDWEGCLSIPDIRGQVPRWHRVSVSGLDAQGDAIAFEIEGFTARVIQHEVDHLDGILFLDRMADMGSLAFREEFFRYRDDEEC